MLYHPEGLYVWDTWYFVGGGRAHCIHLQIPRPGSDRDSRETGALGHAVSDDLIHWVDVGTALYPGQMGSYDDMELWTGCVEEYDGKFNLFYTARSSRESGSVNRISLATSLDGFVWTKYSDNPILVPDGRWYANEGKPIRLFGHGHPIIDCRDLCVVRDPKGEGWWGFYSARRHAQTNAETSVIGLAHSMDLIHWEQYPPCFTPEGFGCVEVPDVFFLNGRWYMLCLTGNVYGHRGGVSDRLVRHATVYASADDIRGPYHMDPTDNLVLGSRLAQGYSAKTLLWKGTRTMFYTQGEMKAGCSHGCIARPHELITNATGQLRAVWHYTCDSLYKSWDLGGFDDVQDGRWGSIGQWKTDGDFIQGNCLGDWAILPTLQALDDGFVQCRITLQDTSTAGLCVRIPGNDIMTGGIAVILDPQLGQVILTALREFPNIEARTYPIYPGQTYTLRVAFTGNVFMVYVDSELVIQCFEPWAPSGHIALYVEKGSACFDGLLAMREEV